MQIFFFKCLNFPRYSHITLLLEISNSLTILGLLVVKLRHSSKLSTQLF